MDGSDGGFTVMLKKEKSTPLKLMAERTQSDPASDPMTGAELGMEQTGNAAPPPAPLTKKRKSTLTL